jgi:hypothetical protein
MISQVRAGWGTWEASFSFRRAASVAIASGGLVASCLPATEVKAPESREMTYFMPKLEPIQKGSETQQRGDVVIQLVPRPPEVERGAQQSCRLLGAGDVAYNLTHAGQEQAKYEVRKIPVYTVPPSVQFVVDVTNRSNQVLKLESAVLRLNINDAEVELRGGDMTKGILAPGEQKKYVLETPASDRFPQGATFHLGIYGVPTQVDPSGSVSKRENFEWSFAFHSERMTERAAVPVTIQYLTPSQASGCGQ